LPRTANPGRHRNAAGHHPLDGAGKRWEPLVAVSAMRRLELLCFAGVIGVSAVLPGTASAQGRFVAHDRVTTMPPGQVMIHPSRRPVSRPFVPHAFVPFPVFPPAAYAYGPPPAVYEQPSPTVIVSPAPPTFIPSVIEYPNGRYELQGDGIMTPYRWVWIAKIPAPPSAPPEGPPAAGPEARPQPAKERPQAPPKDIYRWVEDDGVTHWSDQKEGIPARYRSKAELTFTAR